jgi:hypothetical protein
VKVRSALGLLALAIVACSARRLPPGTPPPEYELPIIAPWPPPSSDAGADATTAAAQGGAGAPSLPTVAPELSLDAGPR